MSTFSSKVVLVAGATGNVGSGAVRAFLDLGAKVIALSRNQEGLNNLANTLKHYGTNIENLIPHIVDVSNPTDLANLSQAIKDKKLPDIDHVVSSIGPWWNTPPLHEVSPEKFREVLNANFESHFFVYRYLMPFVIDKPGSSYTIVSGTAGDVGSAGLTSVSQNGIFGISKVAFYETKDRSVRVNRLHMSIRIESDMDYDRMVKDSSVAEGSKTQISSRRYGPIFAAFASPKATDLKGKVVTIANTDEVDQLVHKYL
eukprot:TRINITY_DN2352_c0_g1_i1.p1 TRINITY_DN2352_c0_g1~~TRINITY_DN2352_c0_g1_i1.p1  ORF type:complete len:257 (-),score=51.17 TRINITY_DN2352_c0_g1_i1:55-825(-)